MKGERGKENRDGERRRREDGKEKWEMNTKGHREEMKSQQGVEGEESNSKQEGMNNTLEEPYISAQQWIACRKCELFTERLYPLSQITKYFLFFPFLTPQRILVARKVTRKAQRIFVHSSPWTKKSNFIPNSTPSILVIRLFEIM